MARQARWLSIALQIAFSVAFVGYRIGAAVSYQPAVWQDSEGYKAVGEHSWFSSQLWVGSRAPLVPVLMKVTGTYYRYGVLQGVLGGLAWVFLAYTVSASLPASWRRPVVTALVLGFAAAPLVVMWDGSALSESPSLSVLALLCAIGVWLIRRFSWIRLALMGVCAWAFCALRDEDIWVLGTVGLALLAYAAVVVLQGLVGDERGVVARLRENWSRTRFAAAAGAILVLVAVITGVPADASHRNLQNVEHVFFVRIFPDKDRVAWFASHGMPQASQVERLAEDTAPGTAPLVLPDLGAPSWAPLNRWFAHKGLTTYALFLVLHPGYVVTAPFVRPQLAYNFADGNVGFYQPAGYPLSSVLGDIFMPSRFIVLGLALVVLVIAALRRVWRLGVWRFTALFALLGVWAMLLAWHGDGMETARHVVEGEVEARLGVLLALLLALFGPRAMKQPVAGEPGALPSSRP